MVSLMSHKSGPWWGKRTDSIKVSLVVALLILMIWKALVP